MTAEVVILNRNGVGIAADSVATVIGVDPRAHQPRSFLKTHHTQNKLFALSAVEAIALMVYGNSDFGQFPWETIIKEFRYSQQSKPIHATVDQCGRGFIRFLSTVAPSVSEDEQDNTILRTVRWELVRLRRGVEESQSEAVSRGKKLSKNDIHDIIVDLLATRRKTLRQSRSLNVSVSEGKETADRLLSNGLLSRMIDEILGSFSKSNDIAAAVADTVSISIRKVTDCPYSSGLVITGFGRSQLLPALLHYWILGVVDDKLRYARIENEEVSSDQRAIIHPYAQQEMVMTFLRGVHPGYERYLLGCIDDAFEGITSEFGSNIPKLASACSEYKDSIRAASDEYIKEKQYDPIQTIVAVLPKDGLGEMAEALVELTSLTRRVTPDVETVGGPIDVAVISKGDGLVWLNRKHYFKPELNPRYFERVRLGK